MNNYSMIYSQFGCCGNRQISAKYVVDNLVMCENRVNTHSHRAYFTENILNVKELAIPFCIISAAVQHYWSKFHTAFTLHQISPVLLTVSSDLYLRNGASPLRVAAREALHHHITALPVGTHRAM
ncbi:MAG: hypothetical protein IJE12_11580 [Prevotella sp.]|nr:hypothetical protein [Prevotella sp.]